jgi:hypothetical protein
MTTASAIWLVPFLLLPGRVGQEEQCTTTALEQHTGAKPPAGGVDRPTPGDRPPAEKSRAQLVCDLLLEEADVEAALAQEKDPNRRAPLLEKQKTIREKRLALYQTPNKGERP